MNLKRLTMTCGTLAQVRASLLKLAAVTLTISVATVVSAQDYDLSWYTIDGGGGFSAGGGFELEGTIGQPDAGYMSGGSYELNGGFQGVAQESILLGDVNLDGVVNLLDVAAFVDRISSGMFQAEADLNQDGVVNLLDINPFVQLLSGG